MEMFLLGWVCSTEFLRACRGGNYIAFFRLARKATYLQACLMHAHFAKVISVAVIVNFASALNELLALEFLVRSYMLLLVGCSDVI